MIRRHSGQFVLTFFFFLLMIQQPCRANPIVIDPFAWGRDAFLFLLFDALVDFVVLGAAFALVGELIWLNFTDFPRYFLAVVLGGLGIDLVALMVTHPLLAWGLLVVLLTAYNVYLCRLYFALTPAKALGIGLAVGFFTNPLLWGFNQSSF